MVHNSAVIVVQGIFITSICRVRIKFIPDGASNTMVHRDDTEKFKVKLMEVCMPPQRCANLIRGQ